MLKKYQKIKTLYFWSRYLSFCKKLLFLSLLPLLLLSLEVPISHASESICNTTESTASDYAVTFCFDGFLEEGALSDEIMISAYLTVKGDNDPGIQRVSFYLDEEEYLLTDFEAPYSFLLPSYYFKNGVHQLTAKALMRDKELITGESVTLEFENDQQAPAPPEWRPVTVEVEPGEPFVLAAVGDGVSGRSEMYDVVDLIDSWEPDLFFYLGDVYQKGSQTEFYNWYDPSYGKFRNITNPIIGNHEYEHQDGAGFFNYWGDVPHYYSLDAGNWHFIGLNSNCTRAGGCDIESPLYNWLQADLRATEATCTLAFFHHPVFSVGSHGSNEQLFDIWELLAQNQLDLLLTGHEHNYQRWYPLNAEAEIDQEGTTSFVIGTGGHGVRPFKIDNEPRLAQGDDDWHIAYGALRLELWPDYAVYQFINTEGQVRDEGTIYCQGQGGEGIAQTQEAQLIIEAQDAFFGSLVTGNILIEFPDGQQQSFALEADQALILSELQAGTYYLTLEGYGLPVDRLVRFPSEQKVQLRLMTYLDLSLALFVIIFIGFILGGLSLTLYRRMRQ